MKIPSLTAFAMWTHSLWHFFIQSHCGLYADSISIDTIAFQLHFITMPLSIRIRWENFIPRKKPTTTSTTAMKTIKVDSLIDWLRFSFAERFLGLRTMCKYQLQSAILHNGGGFSTVCLLALLLHSQYLLISVENLTARIFGKRHHLLQQLFHLIERNLNVLHHIPLSWAHMNSF